MAKQIAAQDLDDLMLRDGDNVALLDVRETGEYNLAHISGSCSLPRRLIEWRVSQLVPWTGAGVIVCDDDGQRASLAASTLEALGYSDVSVLSGGLNRWVTQGYGTEWGVNVPSKDFGERLLLTQHLPEVEPDELAGWLKDGRKLIMLDSRTPEEHNRACIPGSRSMPGAELGLRIWDLASDDTTVVVHCAGRTRSIVGAGTLQRLGIKNVFALKNGTMGWQLAGLELETGSQRLSLPEPTPEGRAQAESKAREVAQQEGVRYLDAKSCREMIASAASQTVYLIDVRSREEYAAAHVPEFRWVPGGQAVQATDNFVAVRGGAIVFACDATSVRSSMTAAWFRQMGFTNVYVLDGGTDAWRAAGLDLDTGQDIEAPAGLEAARKRVETEVPEGLQAKLRAGGVTVVHVGTSDEFSAAHVPGSRWLSRSWLELRIGEIMPSKASRVILTCKDGTSALLAAATLLDLGYEAAALEGGVDAWRAAGLPVEHGLTSVAQAPDDVLPVRRSYAEMLNYLRWEEQLGEKYEQRS
ncbi:MAG TPA: rhodanese-like domain-containing protein [Dehalococcoidia bacterium]|nr:rhodanese-like domain-containing protein [Dehalococcoidia bacterium]